MPDQPLVTEAPALLVLPQHIHESVHVEACLGRAYPKHHTRSKYPKIKEFVKRWNVWLGIILKRGKEDDRPWSSYIVDEAVLISF